MSQQDIDKLTDKISDLTDQLKRNNGSGGGGRGSYGGDTVSGSSSPSAGGSGVIGSIGTGATNVASGFDRLWRGTLNVNTGFDQLTGILKSSGGELGKVFGNITGILGHTILDTNTALNTSLKHGANYDNNLAEYDKLIKGARMTHEDYNDMIKKGAEEMRGLGSNINLSQKNFLLMAKAVQEGDVGNKLKEIGLHADDLNEVLQGSMSNRRGMDMSDASTKKAAIESSERLVVAMEETARITGESRKDQIEEMKKKSEDARIQMKLSMMDKQAKERYDAGMQQMHQLGPAAEKLYRDQFLGKITKEGSTAIAALGTSAADISRYALAQKDASPEGRERAEALGKTAVSSNIEWQNSVGAKNFGMYGEGAAADMVVDSYAKNKLREPTNAKIDEVKNQTGQTIDAATAIDAMKDTVHKGMKQQNADGSPIDTDGAKVATAINKADRKLADLTAGTTEVFGGLISETGKLIKDFKDLDTVLAPMTQEAAAPFATLKNAANDFVANKPFKDAFAEGSKDQTHEKTTPAQMAADVKPVVSRADGSPSFDNFLNGGNFSSMFEKFDPAGTPAELHGEELIATRKQMEKFVEKMMPMPSIGQPSSTPPELPSLPPIDLKNESKTPSTTTLTPNDAAATATESANKILAQSLNVVSDRIKDLTAALHDFKPVDHVNKVIEKVATVQKSAQLPVQPPVAPVATPKPAVSQHPELKKIADQINADKAKETKKEEKPAEIKKEEPKLLNLGIKTAEDLNKFLFGGMPPPKESTKEDKDKLMEQGKTAESFFKSNTEKVSDQMREQFNKMAPNPFDKLPVPKVDELNITKPLTQGQSTDTAVSAVSKHIEDLSKSISGPLADFSTTNKIEKPESSFDNMFSKFTEAFKLPDIKMPSEFTKLPDDLLKTQDKSNDIISKNLIMYSDSITPPDLNETFKTLSDQVGESISTKLPESNTDELNDIVESFNSSSYNSMFSDINEMLPSLSSIKSDNEEAEEESDEDESKPAEPNSPSEDLSKRDVLFQSPTMTMYDESEEKQQQRKDQQAKANDKSPGIFDSISNFFTSSNKPAFASGNVKYENVTDDDKALAEEKKKIDAKINQLQKEGQIEVTAERARQADSGRYKQKEPEKPKVEEVKKPAESKEDAHVKEMYKKYGLETFKDFNTRMSAEVKQSHAQIKSVSENKRDLSPKDVAPIPVAPPKPVDQPIPAAQPQQQQQYTEKEITLKEIHDDLIQLNKAIAEMAHSTDQIKNNSHKQVSETKKLSGSRW